MGRGVEVRGDALVTVYADWTANYDYWRDWQIEMFEDMGQEWEESDVDEDAFYRDDYYHTDVWEDNRDWFIQEMKIMFPSFTDTDRWGSGPYWNETHVVLENGLVEVGIADYSGVTALTIAPLGGRYAEYPVHLGLAARWAQQIEGRFEQAFGRYAKIGTFSNGESVYSVKEEVSA